MSAEYIVTGNHGPMAITHYDDTPKAGILIYDEHSVTVFNNYNRANRAIKRSQQYSLSHSLF